MPLTDIAVRNAKPGKHPTDPEKNGKPYKLSDGGGMYLYVSPKGAKSWRLQYRFGGKERAPLTFGLYPEVGLADARAKRDAARKLLASGIDPGVARKLERANRAAELASGFETVAREWYATRRSEWAPSYGDKVIARLEADVFPYVGTRSIAEINPPELLVVLRRIEARGAIETARRVCESLSQVFRFAVATGRASSDPARDLKGALRKPVVRHFAAITHPERMGQLLRAIYGYSGSLVVCTALKLAPMLLLRPGELRHAQWDEFDLDNATWMIPAMRMKRQRIGKLEGPPHFVPLPRQAVVLLRELHTLTGRGSWVFRGERHHDRPMSENTVNAALRAMGFPRDEVTGHGFRASARTMLHERLEQAPDVIEAQLAHTVPDSLGRAYNRTEFIDQRRAMMQLWADYLDALRVEPNATPILRIA